MIAFSPASSVLTTRISSIPGPCRGYRLQLTISTLCQNIQSSLTIRISGIWDISGWFCSALSHNEDIRILLGFFAMKNEREVMRGGRCWQWRISSGVGITLCPHYVPVSRSNYRRRLRPIIHTQHQAFQTTLWKSSHPSFFQRFLRMFSIISIGRKNQKSSFQTDAML